MGEGERDGSGRNGGAHAGLGTDRPRARQARRLVGIGVPGGAGRRHGGQHEGRQNPFRRGCRRQRVLARKIRRRAVSQSSRDFGNPRRPRRRSRRRDSRRQGRGGQEIRRARKPGTGDGGEDRGRRGRLRCQGRRRSRGLAHPRADRPRHQRRRSARRRRHDQLWPVRQPDRISERRIGAQQGDEETGSLQNRQFQPDRQDTQDCGRLPAHQFEKLVGDARFLRGPVGHLELDGERISFASANEARARRLHHPSGIEPRAQSQRARQIFHGSQDQGRLRRRFRCRGAAR